VRDTEVAILKTRVMSLTLREPVRLHTRDTNAPKKMRRAVPRRWRAPERGEIDPLLTVHEAGVLTRMRHVALPTFVDLAWLHSRDTNTPKKRRRRRALRTVRDPKVAMPNARKAGAPTRNVSALMKKMCPAQPTTHKVNMKLMEKAMRTYLVLIEPLLCNQSAQTWRWTKTTCMMPPLRRLQTGWSLTMVTTAMETLVMRTVMS